MKLYDIPLDAPASWAKTGVPRELKPQRASFMDFDELLAGEGKLSARNKWISRYGFAVPTADVIEELAKARLLELGAGAGWWASLIAAQGGDIVATDKASTEQGNTYGQRISAHYPVEAIDAAEAVLKYPDRDLLMIWPCLGRQWSLDAVRTLATGQSVYIVGEGYGGCTGTDDLWDYLGDNFDKPEYRALPNWVGIHDGVHIYRNKSADRTKALLQKAVRSS